MSGPEPFKPFARAVFEIGRTPDGSQDIDSPLVKREIEKERRYRQESEKNKKRGDPEIEYIKVPVQRSPDSFWHDRAEKVREIRREQGKKDKPDRFKRKDGRQSPKGKGSL